MEAMFKNAAFNAPLELGQEIDLLGRRYTVLAEISREDWWADVLRRRALNANAGLPPARAGFYRPEAKTFEPSREEPGSEFRYCYRLQLC
jgi:hypothetical protein